MQVLRRRTQNKRTLDHAASSGCGSRGLPPSAEAEVVFSPLPECERCGARRRTSAGAGCSAMRSAAGELLRETEHRQHAALRAELVRVTKCAQRAQAGSRV